MIVLDVLSAKLGSVLVMASAGLVNKLVVWDAKGDAKNVKILENAPLVLLDGIFLTHILSVSLRGALKDASNKLQIMDFVLNALQVIN